MKAAQVAEISGGRWWHGGKWERWGYTKQRGAVGKAASFPEENQAEVVWKHINTTDAYKIRL